MKRCLTILSMVAMLLTGVGCFTAAGQNYNQLNWYFGDSNLGIRFNRTDNSASIVTNQATPFGTGGSAVASERTTGNLLFYTDGNNIYDATHSIMPGGAGIGGNPSGNQPVAIARVPGQNTQYYVFINNGPVGGSVSFYIVDMNLPGNSTLGAPFLGEVLPGGPTAVPGLATTSDAMITVPHDNGDDFWLLTHSVGTNLYTATQFSATNPPSSVSTGLGLVNNAANFAYHEGTGRIAVSPKEQQRDIEILTFDNATGAFGPLEIILNTGTNGTGNQAIYDTEWSNSGDFLYISRHGETGIAADVLQYIIGSQSGSSQVTIESVLPQAIFRSFGLQMAPDSVIYHLYQATTGGPFLLGGLTNTDTIASAVNYDPSILGAQDFDAMQFPSFAPQDTVGLTVSFVSLGTCQNAPTSFFPTVSPRADSLNWDFGDGNGSNAWSPVHTYENAGAFNVTVTAFLNGSTANFTAPVNITAFDLQLSLVQDTTACACELPINNGEPLANGSTCPDDTSDDFSVEVTAQGGTPQYQWFGPGGLLPGQTSTTLRPDSAGYYYVVATMGGCQAYAGVNIKEYDSLDQRANIWHFGQNAGIDFNGLPDDPAVPIQGPLDTPEGTSVISDRNGQVIFSTDGQNLFDKEDNDITPVGGLGGDPGATQSALIIPVPGDETLFYIFTTQEIYGGGFRLSYSLFDLKLRNGLGDLVIHNQPLFGPSTERITSNGNWLIAHEYGNNSFRAYRISQQGISSPVITAIGSDHNSAVAENGQGYMEIGTPSRIAVALSTPGISNVVEIFDFVDSTGVVTNFRSIDLNTTAGQVYRIEISPGGNKLFATVTGSPSEIFEYAFDSLGNPYFKNSVTHPQELGAMQIGPDGQIYMALNNSNEVWTFQANEDTTAVTNLTNLQPFALLGGTQSRLGLPNFTQIISNPAMQPGFTFVGTCLGDSTRFSATGKDPAIDKFDWSFSTGESFTDAGPEFAYLFPAPGTYTASVRIYNKCEEVGTFTETVVINDIPPHPFNPDAGVLCTGTLDLDANPQDLPNFTYQWSTGETTEVITVDRLGEYDVTITDERGCTRDASFFAADNRPQIDLGPDLTICQNTPIAPLDALNLGDTYVWGEGLNVNPTPNGNTTQTQSVDTSVPGVLTYTVRIVDIGTPFLCETSDTITFTINESPAFTTTPVPPSACAAADGQIQLNITAPASSLFTYIIAGPTSSSQVDQPVGNYVIPGLAAGTYGVTVQDQVSGCATIDTESLNDNSFTVTSAPNGTCDPNIAIDVQSTVVVFPLNYNVIDDATGLTVTSDVSNAANFTTAVVPSGTSYTVEVTAGGCANSASPLTITQGPTVDPISFNTSLLCTTRQIEAISANATSFSWTSVPTGAIAAPTTNPATVNPGTWDLTVTADDGDPTAGLCPATANITVTVDPPITADFTQSTPCEDVVTLTATPSGPFTYNWFENGAPILGGQQLPNITTDGNTYRVDVVSTLSGCVYPSTPKIVNVIGTLSVTITGTPPCAGTTFTLTAETPAGSPSVNYTWERDDAVISGATAPTLDETRGGLYEVIITSTVDPACTASDQFSIALLPATDGFLPGTGIICPDPANPDVTTREVELDPGPGFASYEWFLEGQPLNATDQTYTATEAGLYTVNLVNVLGCVSTDAIELFEQCEPRIVGPNVFRPGSQVNEGGELINSQFRLFTFFIADEDFQIFIFNRWGEMVFESPARDFRWNGGYNNNPGQLLPPGTYSYIVRYRSSYRAEDGIQEYRGGVVLMR